MGPSGQGYISDYYLNNNKGLPKRPVGFENGSGVDEDASIDHIS